MRKLGPEKRHQKNGNHDESLIKQAVQYTETANSLLNWNQLNLKTNGLTSFWWMKALLALTSFLFLTGLFALKSWLSDALLGSREDVNYLLVRSEATSKRVGRKSRRACVCSACLCVCVSFWERERVNRKSKYVLGKNSSNCSEMNLDLRFQSRIDLKFIVVIAA